MTTRIYKDRDGWNAETSIDLQNQRVLKLRTGKRSIGGGLQTTATVWTDTGDGGLRHAMGLGTGLGDFSETIVITRPARITEKLVTEQHDRVIKQLGFIQAQIEQFYALQEQKSEPNSAVPA